jgi:hypothetical protein
MKMREIILALLIIFISIESFAETYLEIDADSDDWLFGSDLRVTDQDGSFALYYSASNQLSGGFTWYNSIGKNNIQLTFYSGASRAFQEDSYLNAKGPGWLQDQLEPSLDINLISSGRACVPNTGEFFVYEFKPTANPPRYAINFTQSCSVGSKNQIHGILRINSEYPKYDPNPVAVVVISPNKPIEGHEYSLSGESSRTAQGDIVAYEWEQISGPLVNFVDRTASVASILLPDKLPLGGENLSFKLTVTNTAGYKSSTLATLHVDSKSDPQSYFKTATGTAFPENDNDWESNIQNINFIKVSGGLWGLSAEISLSTANAPYYRLSMGPVLGQELNLGSYPNTARMIGALPTLDYSVGSFGCNQSVGSYEILAIETDAEKFVQRLHARFTHYCESYDAIPTSGEIAFNVLHPSVPKINIVAPSSATAGQTITLDASSSMDDKRIETYSWSGPSGVNIDNSHNAITNVVIPTTNQTTPTVMNFKLHVDDDEGYQAEKIVSISVMPAAQSSSSSPSTNNSSSSGGGSLAFWYLILLGFLLVRSPYFKSS